MYQMSNVIEGWRQMGPEAFKANTGWGWADALSGPSKARMFGQKWDETALGRDPDPLLPVGSK